MFSNLQNLSLFLSGLALVLGIFCLWQIFGLNRLRKTFFMGSRGADLEEVIKILQQQSREQENHQAVLGQAIKHLQNDLSFSFQKMGVVRFNPFDDGGGNFSFCLALLDAHDSGIVLTSMYGREQNRIYTKKIENGGSDLKLTAEERQAVERATSQNKIE